MNLTYEAIAKRIDHALLLPTLTEAEMRAGCRLAAHYEVASVCIKPHAIGLAVEALALSNVAVGTVVGFPHGGQTSSIKVAETIEAIEAGADEIDVVVNIGAVLSENWTLVDDEIGRLALAVHQRKALLKVIFETCYLSDDQKIHLCEICGGHGVDFVKTSTGFGTAGATTNDLILMRRHSLASVKVKASGGIRDLQTAIEFVELGCERLGLSRTAEILDELCEKLGWGRRDVSRGTAMRASDPY